MSKKILVVDDEASVRELISTSIESFTKYEVDVAEDGFEAVKKVMSDDYDMILIDIKMPKMNGIDAVKAIKIIKKNIPIIVITGFASEDEKKLALNFGAEEVLNKPFDVKTLIEKMKSYIEKNQELSAEGNEEVIATDKIIFIGSSVGGPENLVKLFSSLKNENYPPIIVVQHMPEDFIAPVVESVREGSNNSKISLAIDEDSIEKNQIIFANSPYTILVQDGKIKYGSPNLKRENFQPSISNSLINISNQFKANCLVITLGGVSAYIDGEEGIEKAKENGSPIYALDDKSNTLEKFYSRGLIDDKVSLEEIVKVIDNF